MAGLVVISILVISLLLWRRGKCRRNVTIEERNEMYGQAANYEEYDKDAYDTRVVDNNYMYESFRD